MGVQREIGRSRRSARGKPNSSPAKTAPAPRAWRWPLPVGGTSGSPRRAGPFAGALAAAALAVACGPGGDARPGAPVTSAFDRVVLVTIDTLRADHVHCYGAESARTPTLDALAASGVRFENAISPAPLTLPSHTSLMTGLLPPSHGVRHNALFAVDASVPLLAERMHAAGYATAAFVAAVVLDARMGLARGFDVYDDQIGFRRAAQAAFAYSERRADAVVDSTLSWLETAPDRFFLWVHLYDPHAAYDPPPAFALVMPGDPYAGEIAFADSQVGRLLAAVRARHPGDRTLVVVTSDHGESLGEHGEPSHAYGIYDATQRVPLILAGGDLPHGVAVPGVVSLIDVAPTILALAAAPPLASAEGRSLVPLWQSPSAEGRPAYAETVATRIDLGWSPLFGLRTDRWKYIRAPRPELYDVVSDPGETRDLLAEGASPESTEQAATLDRLLAAHLRDARVAGRRTLDADERERLESLGYVAVENAPSDEDLGRVGGPDPKDHMRVVGALSRVAIALARQRPREAIALLEDLDDGGSRTLAYRGQAALMLGDVDLAKRSARELIRRGVVARGRYLLGMALLQAGDLDAAEEAFRSSQAADPRESGQVVGLALVAEARGDVEAAESRLRQAMALSASAADPRWRLAAILLETGRADEGHALLEALPASELAKPAPAVRLAVAEQKAGNVEAAIVHLSAAADALPDNTEVRRTLAFLLESEGRTEEALVLHEEIYALAPDDPAAQNDLAWYLAQAGRNLDRALRLARSAVAADGTSVSFLDTLATVQLARGDAAAALGAADRGLALGEAPDAHLLYVRAAALASLGRRREAVEALARSRRVLAGVTPEWESRAAALERQLGRR